MWFSEPKPIEAKRYDKREFEDVEKRLTDRIRERGTADLSVERLQGLSDVIASIVDKRYDTSQRERNISREAARPAALLQHIAYYASVFFGSQLFVVHERQAT